jgi:hypothetical protein
MNILLSYSEELFRNQTNSLVDEFLSFFRLNNLNADKLRIPCKWGEPEKIINQILFMLIIYHFQKVIFNNFFMYFSLDQLFM